MTMTIKRMTLANALTTIPDFYDRWGQEVLNRTYASNTDMGSETRINCENLFVEVREVGAAPNFDFKPKYDGRDLSTWKAKRNLHAKKFHDKNKRL